METRLTPESPFYLHFIQSRKCPLSFSTHALRMWERIFQLLAAFCYFEPIYLPPNFGIKRTKPCFIFIRLWWLCIGRQELHWCTIVKVITTFFRIHGEKSAFMFPRVLFCSCLLYVNTPSLSTGNTLNHLFFWLIGITEGEKSLLLILIVTFLWRRLH